VACRYRRVHDVDEAAVVTGDVVRLDGLDAFVRFPGTARSADGVGVHRGNEEGKPPSDCTGSRTSVTAHTALNWEVNELLVEGPAELLFVA